jgi:FkbM family methyltransferase
MESLKTIDITYGNRTIALPDLPIYSKFYHKLSAGTWEPNTFAVLGRNLDRETVYVDIGAWIGVTPFWATHIAKAVIAVEPDPACIDILDKLCGNFSNLTVINGALAKDVNVQLNSVSGFGSSASSILNIGDGDSIVVNGYSIDDIMQSVGQSSVFVKIDIEGYEFNLSEEVKKLQKYNLRGLQLAVHPHLYERGQRGNLLLKRLRTVISTRKLGNIFRGFFAEPTVAGYSSLLSYIIFGVLLRLKPKGADFIFERKFPSPT